MLCRQAQIGNTISILVTNGQANASILISLIFQGRDFEFLKVRYILEILYFKDTKGWKYYFGWHHLSSADDGTPVFYFINMRYFSHEWGMHCLRLFIISSKWNLSRLCLAISSLTTLATSADDEVFLYLFIEASATSVSYLWWYCFHRAIFIAATLMA